MSKGRRSSLRSVGLNQPINELGTSRLLHNTGVSFAFCLPPWYSCSQQCRVEELDVNHEQRLIILDAVVSIVVS